MSLRQHLLPKDKLINSFKIANKDDKILTKSINFIKNRYSLKY